MRLSWPDDVKFFAIIIMLIGHVSRNLIDQNSVFGAAEFEVFIATFNMPLFVIISGWGNYNSLSRIESFNDLLRYLCKSFCRILMPLLIPTIFYTIVDNDISFLNIEKICWFLWMIFYLMTIFAISVYLSKKVCSIYPQKQIINLDVDLICSLMLFCIVSCLFDRMYTPEFCIYFAIGFICRKYSFFEKIKKNGWIPLLIGITALSLLIIFYDVQTRHLFYWCGIRQMKAAGLLFHYGVRQFIAVGLSVAIVQIIMVVSKKRTFISEWGSYTLAIYVIQDMIMHYSKFFQIPFVGEYLSWIVVITAVVLIIAICVYLTKLLSYGCSFFRCNS